MGSEATHFRPHSGVRAIVGAALWATILLALAAWWRGAPETITWYIAHIWFSVLVILVSATVGPGRWVRWSLGVYAILIPLLAVGVVLVGLVRGGVPGRVALYADNPNLLAAGMVTALAAAMSIWPRAPWHLLLPMAALGVVATGSRLALAACLIAWLSWVASAVLSSRFSLRNTVVTVFLGGAVATLLATEMYGQYWSRNLLVVSETFQHGAWTVPDSLRTTVSRAEVEGPLRGHRVARITSEEGGTSLLVYQSVRVRRQDINYVASVYLRSDQPQQVRLSTHFSSQVCSVGSEWTRCETPPGTPTGGARPQFRVERVSGDSVDVYLYGPQYEQGGVATAYEVKSPTLFSGGGLSRLVRVSDPSQLFADARGAILRQGWKVFLASPLVGSGRAAPDAMSLLRAPQVPLSGTHAHSHNFVIERLAADGIVGFAGWFLYFVVIARYSLLFGGRSLVPFLASVSLLNSLDLTLFHSICWISSSVVVGTYLHRGTSRPLERVRTRGLIQSGVRRG